MYSGRMVRQDDTTGESLKVKGSKKLDKDMMEALTADDGPLASGALPKVRTSSESGAKLLHQALDDDKAAFKPKKEKKKEDKAEEVKPKTPLDVASNKMATALDQVSKARSKSLQLTGVDFGKELSDQLGEHAKQMEDLWKKLNKMVLKEDKSNPQIAVLSAAVDEKTKWWDKAVAGKFKRDLDSNVWVEWGSLGLRVFRLICFQAWSGIRQWHPVQRQAQEVWQTKSKAKTTKGALSK